MRNKLEPHTTVLAILFTAGEVQGHHQIVSPIQQADRASLVLQASQHASYRWVGGQDGIVVGVGTGVGSLLFSVPITQDPAS